MKRFRFTLIAVSLFLIWLGSLDARIVIDNPHPAPVSTTQLVSEPAPREWLSIENARLDLLRAISTSGSVELEALLVPLVTDSTNVLHNVWIETRNPGDLQLFSTYHFKMDSALEKERFLAENAAAFTPQRTVTGMLITGLIASGNLEKLRTLIPDKGEILFLSEGQTPSPLRGGFYLLTGLAGLVVTIRRWKAPQKKD